ncbi:MAG: thiamine phosphate synthase [Bacteroidia bacterium]|nr:thiamine phosphate synthase [Bacteroidia bacterium]MDW8133970.1 thiamine phosphate synthase [Bacteroidia bacterium]
MLRIGRIHILTDTQVQQRFSHYELCEKAIAAGIPTIQYREKKFSPQRHMEELRRIAELARRTHTQLIINDHVELAAEIGATGIHIGEEDMPVEEVMRKVPAFTLIGVTVHSMEFYERVRRWPIAYVGVGPVFETSTKDSGRPPLGIDGLRTYVEAISHPVIAIGGITPERARMLFEAVPNLHGVAVLSAFCKASEPIEVARELMALLPSN